VRWRAAHWSDGVGHSAVARVRRPSQLRDLTIGRPAPSAQASTIRDRKGRACADVGRRVHARNCSRSPTLSTIGTATGKGITTPYRLTSL
jgi:hypothetical protein